MFNYTYTQDYQHGKCLLLFFFFFFFLLQSKLQEHACIHTNTKPCEDMIKEIINFSLNQQNQM